MMAHVRGAYRTGKGPPATPINTHVQCVGVEIARLANGSYDSGGARIGGQDDDRGARHGRPLDTRLLILRLEHGRWLVGKTPGNGSSCSRFSCYFNRQGQLDGHRHRLGRKKHYT